MYEGFNNGPSLRPTVEYQVPCAMSQRVLDAGFQVLPLGITEMIVVVGAGRSTSIIAVRNGQQGQAEMCQWLKSAQCFFPCHPTTMYQNGPGVQFASNIPRGHWP